MQLVDTHLHLDSDDFADREPEIVARAHEAGVVAMISVATSATSSRRVLELSRRLPGVFPAVGIQPNDVVEASEEDWKLIEQLVLEFRDEIVAIGETGIDCYWDRTPLPQQRDFFDRHLRLAREHDLPVIIHMRESGQEIIAALRRAWGSHHGRAVMHSFTGDRGLLEQCLELGLYVSFAGMVTFKKSEDLREVARAVPLDRILVETDSPYLSPEPLRGRRPNEPARVVHTARCLAELRGISLDEFARQTTANAVRLFGDLLPPYQSRQSSQAST